MEPPVDASQNFKLSKVSFDNNNVINQAEFSFNIIPEYLFKYLTRKGIGNDYLLSDLVIDKRLSVQELSVIFYLNNNALEQVGGFSPWLGLGKIDEEIRSRKQFGDESLNTRIETAITLSYGESVKKETYDLINSVCNESSPSYDIVVMGTKIWLIVKPGFLAVLKDPLKRLNFYRDYLKTIGKIVPFDLAARTSVFAHYVEELLG